MTDELTINPQIQQKQGSYAVPATVIGGLAGTGTGYYAHKIGIPGVTTEIKSWEDLQKLSNDTIDLQIEKGGESKDAWETAKQYKEKFENAEKDYEKLVEDVKKSSGTVPATELPEGEIKTNLETARTNYNKALEAEKARIAAKSGTRIEIKPAAEMGLPSGYKDFASFERDYKPLQQAYESAVTNAQGTVAYTDAKSAYNNMESRLKNLYSAIDTKVGLLGEKDRAQAFVQKKNGGVFGHRVTVGVPPYVANDSVYTDIINKVKAEVLTEPTELTNAQKKALGEFIPQTDATKVPKKIPATEEIVRVYDKSGKLEGYLKLPKGTEQEALNKAKSEVAAQQRAIADEIFGKARNHFELTQQKNNFDANFKASPEELKKAGLTDLTGLQSKSVYENHAKALESVKGLERARLNPAETAIVNAYDSTGTKSTKEIFNMIEARKNIATRKEAKLAELTTRIENIVAQDSRVIDLKEKMNQVERQDKGVRKAYGKIKHKFAELFKGEGSLSETEIASKAEEAVKAKDVATKLKAAEDAAKAELEKLGKNVGELSGDELAKVLKEKGIAASLEDYKKGITEEAKSNIEKNLGKLKTPNRWANAAIGAGILALAGLGIGYAVKKDS